MKSDIFYWILNMSIHGSLICLIVLLLRRIRRLPAGFTYALWSLPLLRLWIPLGLNSSWNLAGLLEKLGTRQVPVNWNAHALPEELPFSAMNFTQLANEYFPIRYQSYELTQTMQAAALVWMIVAAVCVIATVFLYLLTRRAIKNAIRQEEFYISDQVNAPALYGIVKPKIVLPPWVAEQDIEFILLHERVHSWRLDNLWRCVAILTCCIHWFNPVCWVCLKYFFSDMELSCDRVVLRILEPEQHKSYALALLNTAKEKSLFISAFGGARIRLRIENVLSYKKLTAAACVALGLLFGILAIALVTN